MTLSLDELLRLATRTEIAKINVSIPATVISYDRTTQTITARPVVADRFADGSQHKPPTLYNVPVGFPSATGYSITWELSAGDPVIIHFAHRSIDEWIMTGEPDTIASDPRRFSASDAMAVPQLNSPAKPIPSSGLDPTAMVIRASEIKLGSSAASDFVALSSKVETIMSTVKTWLDAHVHADPLSGSTGPPTVPSPSIGSTASAKVKSE